MQCNARDCFSILSLLVRCGGLLGSVPTPPKGTQHERTLTGNVISGRRADVCSTPLGSFFVPPADA